MITDTTCENPKQKEKNGPKEIAAYRRKLTLQKEKKPNCEIS